jgi:hypothetical protein
MITCFLSTLIFLTDYFTIGRCGMLLVDILSQLKYDDEPDVMKRVLRAYLESEVASNVSSLQQPDGEIFLEDHNPYLVGDLGALSASLLQSEARNKRRKFV